jgi:hypothetical protein
MGLIANGRREVMRVALAAAEVCWLTPIFLVFSRTLDVHHPFLLWLGLLVLYLGYSYFYRALVEVHLRLWLQQTLSVLALLLSILLVLRFHVLAGEQVHGLSWLWQPFLHLVDETTVMPIEWAAILIMVYLWVRGIHLARRSLSVQSVGFSFRAGVVILMLVAVVLSGPLKEDVSVFIVPFFFLALAAVALARVEEVAMAPNSSAVKFSGFWIGTTLGAVALLMVVSMAVALFFYGGGLEQILRWLYPVFVLVQIIIAGIGVLLLSLIQLLLSLFSIDLISLAEGLQRALQRLGQIADLGRLAGPPPAESTVRPPFLSILQTVVTVAIPVVAVLIVVLITWNRLRRAHHREGDEVHESLLTAGMLASSLRSLLGAGRDRLGELAGLVDRFGMGARFLSAISIRRIYANLVRLATGAGFPRGKTQTPYEYVRVLRKAFPDSEADVTVITEAYVNAHYGQVPDTHEGLQEIRDCWERVQAREVERQKKKAR